MLRVDLPVKFRNNTGEFDYWDALDNDEQLEFAINHMIENIVPSIELLEARLEQGCQLAKLGDRWHLFDRGAGEVASGESLRKLMINLVWVDV